MSTVIDMRVYLDPRDSRGAAAFTKCVDAVSHWLGHEPSEQWQDLRLAESMPHNNVTTVPDPMSALELKAAVDSLPGCPEQILKSGIGFPCWRFRPDGPYRGFLRAGVECWDADCKRLRRGKVWIEGNARLVISSVNPFQAALQERPFPNREEINRRVEENIECFLQLVFNVAKFLRPVSIKVFSDTGDLLPFNAYLAFYNTNHGVINDLSNIAEMWKVGIPEYGIPPFEPYAKRHD